MIRKWMCVAILVGTGILTPAASADQSYKVTLGSPAKVKDADLRAGQYKITIDGPKVTFTEVNSGKMFELAAKVESVDKKFDTTEIHTRKGEGGAQISEIRIGGSKTRIVFE